MWCLYACCAGTSRTCGTALLAYAVVLNNNLNTFSRSGFRKLFDVIVLMFPLANVDRVTCGVVDLLQE
jgi:hypothetical protein